MNGVVPRIHKVKNEKNNKNSSIKKTFLNIFLYLKSVLSTVSVILSQNSKALGLLLRFSILLSTSKSSCVVSSFKGVEGNEVFNNSDTFLDDSF